VQAIRNLAQLPRFDLILRTRGACREGMRCATRRIIVRPREAEWVAVKRNRREAMRFLDVVGENRRQLFTVLRRIEDGSPLVSRQRSVNVVRHSEFVGMVAGLGRLVIVLRRGLRLGSAPGRRRTLREFEWFEAQVPQTASGLNRQVRAVEFQLLSQGTEERQRPEYCP
jgi:hypothetical protein